MKRILILEPRLDTSFKPGTVPLKLSAPTHSIRYWWQIFADVVDKSHKSCGDEVRRVVLPLWQFSPELVTAFDVDLVYVPHREYHDFLSPMATIGAQERVNVLYYMQSVFPHIFYCDRVGWAGGMSHERLKRIADMTEKNCTYLNGSSVFETLSKRAMDGLSKFEQAKPNDDVRKNLMAIGSYVAFICQLPHDYTIKHHSSVCVEDALRRIIEVSPMPVIVRGHPANPGSMQSLIDIVQREHNRKVYWMDPSAASIHDFVSCAHTVALVNSGVGMEALLHNRQVVIFGRSDYNCMAVDGNVGLHDALSKPHMPAHRIEKLHAFFDAWHNECIDLTEADDRIAAKLMWRWSWKAQC